jgi:hypothetical protein
MLLVEIPGEYAARDTGKFLVQVILLSLFIGGTLLLVRSFIDFMHSRKARSKRDTNNRRKAA